MTQAAGKPLMASGQKSNSFISRGLRTLYDFFAVLFISFKVAMVMNYACIKLQTLLVDSSISLAYNSTVDG